MTDDSFESLLRTIYQQYASNTIEGLKKVEDIYHISFVSYVSDSLSDDTKDRLINLHQETPSGNRKPKLRIYARMFKQAIESSNCDRFLFENAITQMLDSGKLIYGKSLTELQNDARFG